MQRRHFLELSLYATLGVSWGCTSLRSPNGRPSADHEISLQGDESAIRNAVANSYEHVQRLIEGTYDDLLITYPGDDGQESAKEVWFSFVDNEAASYPHLRIEKPNGDAANLVWRRSGLSPAIQFVSDDGDPIETDGTELTFPFTSALDGWDTVQGDGFSNAGVKLMAAGLAAWLGVKLTGVVLSAISVIAFTALVLGVLMIALDRRDEVMEWVIEKTGWSPEQIRAFVEEAVSDLHDWSTEIQEFVQPE